MAGVLGHTLVTAITAGTYRKELNITTLFCGMVLPDLLVEVFFRIPFIPGVNTSIIDETFLGGSCCGLLLSLIILIGFKIVPNLMWIFKYKQASSAKIIIISALIGTELHVLMDLIAKNSWINI